jgi:hypothetical protein
MPNGGDVLVQSNANLIGNLSWTNTGSGNTWNVDASVLTLNANYTTTNCTDIGSAPAMYQLFFNTPWDPEHNSDYCIVTTPPTLPLDQLGLPINITIDNTYAFYQVRSDRYAMTGFGATVSGIPTGAIGDGVDVIYELPMNQGQSYTGNSYFQYDLPSIGTYSTEQTRVTDVLASGTMNYFGTDYPVLLVRSQLDANDSIYIAQFSLGFPFPRPQTVEYKWLTPGMPIPLIQINQSVGQTTGVLAYDPNYVPDGISSKVIQAEGPLYPNPTWGVLKSNSAHASGPYRIVNVQGQLMQQGIWQTGQELNVQALPAGTYVLEVSGKRYPWIKE